MIRRSRSTWRSLRLWKVLWSDAIKSELWPSFYASCLQEPETWKLLLIRNLSGLERGRIQVCKACSLQSKRTGGLQGWQRCFEDVPSKESKHLCNILGFLILFLSSVALFWFLNKWATYRNRKHGMRMCCTEVTMGCTIKQVPSLYVFSIVAPVRSDLICHKKHSHHSRQA